MKTAGRNADCPGWGAGWEAAASLCCLSLTVQLLHDGSFRDESCDREVVVGSNLCFELLETALNVVFL